MFLFVSVRHVGAHVGEHKRGVSIQISITGWNVSSDISYTKYSSDLNLGEGLCICTSFLFPDSGLYLLNGFDFYFDLFWMVWHWKPAIRPRRSRTGISCCTLIINLILFICGLINPSSILLIDPLYQNSVSSKIMINILYASSRSCRLLPPQCCLRYQGDWQPSAERDAAWGYSGSRARWKT